MYGPYNTKGLWLWNTHVQLTVEFTFHFSFAEKTSPFLRLNSNLNAINVEFLHFFLGKVILQSGWVELKKKLRCLVATEVSKCIPKKCTHHIHFPHTAWSNLQMFFKILKLEIVDDVPKQPLHFTHCWIVCLHLRS